MGKPSTLTVHVLVPCTADLLDLHGMMAPAFVLQQASGCCMTCQQCSTAAQSSVETGCHEVLMRMAKSCSLVLLFCRPSQQLVCSLPPKWTARTTVS